MALPTLNGLELFSGVGMLGEGALVGLIGGLLGVPTGFLLGSYLVKRFGSAMLAGSGSTTR